ncbi:MAG: hypothetical protein ABEK04_04325 [Candidatus Nanohalobium sp.]
MTELIAFKALEFLVSIGIVYGAYRIDGSTNSRAWRLLSMIGVFIAAESLLQISLIMNNFGPRMLEGLFEPSIAVLLIGTGLSFVNEYGSFGRIKQGHILGYTIGCVAGSLALAFLAPSFMASTAMYLGTPLLLLPSIYLFYRMQKGGEKVIFASFTASASFYTVASLMNLYLATAGGFIEKIYSFTINASVPEIEALVTVSSSAPVLKMTGTMFLGFSIYLFYHGVFRDIYSKDESSDEGNELATTAVENIGAIIGKPVAERMAKKALNKKFEKDAETVEKAAKGEELEDVEKALEKKFGNSVGPVGKKKIKEIAEETKGE